MRKATANRLRIEVKEAIKKHPNFNFKNLFRMAKREYNRTPWHLRQHFTIFS